MRSGLLITVLALTAAMLHADAPVVDEPLGARYSLGMTLWHMGHSADMIERFHEYLADRDISAEGLLSEQELTPPGNGCSVLIEPELLTEEQRTGWGVKDEFITSGATDAGPSVSFPLEVPRAGLYRLWVQYYGWTTGTGVTRIRIYPGGLEREQPILNDEIYDYAVETEGLHWKDALVDLDAGEYTVTLSHVTRWWHHGKGPRGYSPRRIDCLYLTDRIWADPPEAAQREAIRALSDPRGIQWTATAPLSAEEQDQWRKWTIRPVSWSDAERSPKLFELSRSFWREQVDALAADEYDEADPPDYREDRRQVIFDDRWNMLGNPVRIRRQIQALESDLRTGPTPHLYYWVNVGEFDEVTGSWERSGTALRATYSDFGGEAKHSLKVDKAGEYHVWVRFRNINYHAPWKLTVSSQAGAPIEFERDQQSYPKDGTEQATWQKVGALAADAGGKLDFLIVPRPFKQPGTYRGIYAVVATTDPDYTPEGPTKPAITREQYAARARGLGVAEDAPYMMWAPPAQYVPLSQVSWPDDLEQGKLEQAGAESITQEIVMARNSYRAAPIYLRSAGPEPVTLKVDCGPLVSDAGQFPGKLTWRAIGFAPHGPQRQHWSPFVLLRRPDITVPPWNAAGLWLTLDGNGLPPGEYNSTVTLSSPQAPERRVQLRVRVSPVEIAPDNPVLVGGWTAPPEGEAHMLDYQAHGMNIWYQPMPKDEMQRRGIKLLALPLWDTSPEACREYIDKLKGLGLDYSDWIFTIRDEPHGKSEDDLKAFLDVAKTIRQVDPKARVSFNPGEAGSLATFEILDPYCDFWIPYTIHRTYHPSEAAAKRAIFTAKPWMWYTTPCLWDKSPGLPTQLYDQIRSVPEQPGNCVGTAFFAFYYPFRDPWDTAYEHISDAAVTVLPSRNGPVPTRTWEAIREGIQHANLAMMVRERAGAKTIEGIADEDLRKLISEGSVAELLKWLEG